jgi:hypothetical protein
MTLVFVLTLPGLVVLLTIAGAVEFAFARLRARNAPNAQRLPVATAGFDMLGITLAPAVKHRIQHDACRKMRRAEIPDAAPEIPAALPAASVPSVYL